MQNIRLDIKNAYLLLGTNLGNREGMLNAAIALIRDDVGEVKRISATYETAAWGKTDQPDFLNIALMVATSMTAKNLLNQVLSIEEQLGRVRKEKWGARLIDIDIIFYGDEVIEENDLKIPHPEMHNRKFVLKPLAEIAAEHKHPILKKSVAEILLHLSDPLLVVKK